MKISARNAFKGTITALKAGSVNSEVGLTTAGGEQIVSIVTRESVKSLGLEVGVQATALANASSVIVMTKGDPTRLSAHNCLRGKITAVAEGAVSADVTIALPSGTLVHATVTRDSATTMGLRAGVDATAIIKSSSVIIAVET